MDISVSEKNEITLNPNSSLPLKLPVTVQDLGIDPNSDSFHNYPRDGQRPIRSEIGFKSDDDWNRKYGNHVGRPFNMGPTTRENAFMALRHAPAPETLFNVGRSVGAAVKTGDVSNVPGLGSVMHLVYPEHGVIVNVTRPDHVLHPGIVVRELKENDGFFYVETSGIGTGIMPEFNERTAKQLWSNSNWSVSGGVDGRLMQILSRYGTKPMPENENRSR